MQETNGKIIVLIGAACAAVIAIGWIAFCGYTWSWGPFHRLHDVKTEDHPGNAAKYMPEAQAKLPVNVLTGKRIVCLGSAVTYGASAKGISFADYLGVRDGCEIVKEAVSGTTLVNNGPDSYISRMKRLSVEEPVDLFLCQLSTNDASQRKPLGMVTDSRDIAAFDTGTVAGAIEYIIACAKETYNCKAIAILSFI